MQNPSYYGLEDTEQISVSAFLSKLVQDVVTALEVRPFATAAWNAIAVALA